ncbi:molybdopterin-dependent oxidoreductase [Acetomicrobium sp. S15 = DSM 107314]|uniref:molybdopterin-dependent oxidoreductase n=1 Tax=Acetomicrobium sp. S15 = DSM 107314 TaxID=2529858 RepID=UPI0018E1872E|nr:molybdopterin-dependent oxidoreductase [Acetomicrobium sp. S15 = DSM 107314]
MKEITLTIDGKTCKGELGDTVLQVARKNDVYIPTLCFLEGLSPIGSCRMCVVETEGSNKLLTSCTTPAQDGMAIITKSPKLHDYRRQILELLFADRNHFCMYCSQSGDCELQKLAIEHGMDSVRFPYLYSKFDVDTTNEDIMMDHNRCILCLRCIRVCSEKVGAHALDLEKRGWQAKVVSDLGQKLGESESCVECGACAQVCPTGTITIRDFVYRGRRNECDAVVESICPLCSVGCQIKAYVRTGSVVRVEGSNLEGPDGGQLCYQGRWWLPEATERERILTPLVRRGAEYVEASWEEALNLISAKLGEAQKSGRAGALLSSLCTDEELTLFSAFFRNALGIDNVDAFDGDVMRGFIKGFAPFREQGICPFTAAKNILNSDLIMMLSADPQREAPVVASYIRVATLHNGAYLVNASSYLDPFPGITDLSVRLPENDEGLRAIELLAQAVAALAQSTARGEEKEYEASEDLLSSYREALDSAASAFDVDKKSLEELIMKLSQAKRPVFVLGKNLTKNHRMVTAAANLAIASQAFFDDGLGVVPLLFGGNALGAINTIVSEEAWLGKKDLDFLYVFSTGMIPEDAASLAAISSTKFVAVQVPYMVRPLVNLADVILPAPAWYERSGHFCTIEGETRRLNVIVPPPAEMRPLSYVLDGMAKNLGVTIGKAQVPPCEAIFAQKVPSAKARMVLLQEVY